MFSTGAKIRFVLQTALRDARSSWRRLVLLSASIVVGTAAISAVGLFGRSVQASLDSQARRILGADLVVTSREPLAQTAVDVLQKLGDDRAWDTSFRSMVSFPRQNASRIVQVRAIEGGYPFYGGLTAEPPAAAEEFRTGGGALVDQTVMLQFDLHPGDTLKLGELELPIAGSLIAVPGESFARTIIAPQVFIARRLVNATHLLQIGSIGSYRVYYRFMNTVERDRAVAAIDHLPGRSALETETVEQRRRNISEAVENITPYVKLLALFSLLLGALGAASAVLTYVKRKTETMAVLQCLGATFDLSAAVFVIQVLLIGVASSIFGAVLGALAQQFFPQAFAGVLPFEVEAVVNIRPLFEAFFVGASASLLVALAAAASLSPHTPFAVLRSHGDPYFDQPAARIGRRRRAQLLAVTAAAIGFFLICLWELHSLYRAAAIAAAIAGVLLSFFFLSFLLKRILRRAISVRWPYLLRQGAANLYRPFNQTSAILVAFGIGAFFIVVVGILQRSLVEQLVFAAKETQVNAILIDVQPDQRAETEAIARANGCKVLDQAPIVNMRLKKIKGIDVQRLLNDETLKIPRWTLVREYRSTYRSSLKDAEKLTAGTWIARISDAGPVVPVSLEQGMAEKLHVGLDDELLLNVQGLDVTARITSLRTVDWKRVQPNFFMVFPEGVFEEAPQFYLTVLHVPGMNELAALQRELVIKQPNVSVIDLALVVQTLNSVFSQVRAGAWFMGLFSIVTALIVVSSAILSSRSERIHETVLLKILGASAGQLLAIVAVEFTVLGVTAGIAGIILGTAAGWGVVHYIFETAFYFPIKSALAAVAGVVAASVIIGMLLNALIYRRPALEVLRAD